MSQPDIAEPVCADSRFAAIGSGDPFAGFTSAQWYFHQARQTVFFTAFSHQLPDRAKLRALAADIVDKIPQIDALYAGLNGGLSSRDVLDRIVTCEEVDDLDAYPDAWNVSGGDLFTRHDLPMLRLHAVIRRDGPDAAGRRAALIVLSTHALLEGADSAQLSRSQPAGHGGLEQARHQRQWLARVGHWLSAVVLGPAQLLIALVVAPRRVRTVYRSLVFDRAQLRRVAARLGLRQRVLLFALVLYALNRDGKGFPRRTISALYTDMDARNRAGSKNAYFRYWSTKARFRMSGNFKELARTIEAEIDRLEARDNRTTQGLLDAVFSAHRVMRRAFPFVYSDRIFRFAGFYDICLSITPPHRLQGPLTQGLQEPVHVGTFHPGLSQCTFAPGRKHVTASFTVNEKYLAGIAGITPLLNTLDR